MLRYALEGVDAVKVNSLCRNYRKSNDRQAICQHVANGRMVTLRFIRMSFSRAFENHNKLWEVASEITLCQ